MADFTRVHYEALAKILADARSFCINRLDYPGKDLIDKLALEMAAHFEEDNRNFSRVRWLKAVREPEDKT